MTEEYQVHPAYPYVYPDGQTAQVVKQILKVTRDENNTIQKVERYGKVTLPTLYRIGEEADNSWKGAYIYLGCFRHKLLKIKEKK